MIVYINIEQVPSLAKNTSMIHHGPLQTRKCKEQIPQHAEHPTSTHFSLDFACSSPKAGEALA
jgi:hypothetical protein